MFNNLGKINYKVNTSQTKIDLETIKNGINFTEEFIIYKDKKDLDIYDRICDHNRLKYDILIMLF